MTRASMIANIKSRIRYYGKQGYVFVDFKPEELSTQKLVALTKKTGGRFLNELSPMVEYAKEATAAPTRISFEEYKEIKLEESARPRLVKAIQKLTKAYSKAGFGTQDLSPLDLLTKDTKELSRILKMGRAEFLGEFGTSYTYKAKSPWSKKDPKIFSITAAQQLEVEEVEKQVRLARKKAGRPPLKGERFFYPTGRARYVAGLREQLKPGYFERKLETYYNTYMREVEEAARFSDYAAWLLKELNKKTKDEIKAGLDAGIIAGKEFNLLEVYDSESTNLSVMIERAIEIFGLGKYTENNDK